MKDIAPEQVIPPTGLFFYGLWISYRLLQYYVQQKKDCIVTAEQLKNIIFLHQALINSKEQYDNDNDNDINERSHENDFIQNPYRIIVMAYISKLIKFNKVVIRFAYLIIIHALFIGYTHRLYCFCTWSFGNREGWI